MFSCKHHAQAEKQRTLRGREAKASNWGCRRKSTTASGCPRATNVASGSHASQAGSTMGCPTRRWLAHDTKRMALPLRCPAERQMSSALGSQHMHGIMVPRQPGKLHHGLPHETMADPRHKPHGPAPALPCTCTRSSALGLPHSVQCCSSRKAGRQVHGLPHQAMAGPRHRAHGPAPALACRCTRSSALCTGLAALYVDSVSRQPGKLHRVLPFQAMASPCLGAHCPIRAAALPRPLHCPALQTELSTAAAVVPVTSKQTHKTFGLPCQD